MTVEYRPDGVEHSVLPITVHGGETLTLYPGDQVFFVGSHVDGQWGRNTSFIVLRPNESSATVPDER